ncbi:N-acetylmuramoyl-L-alanine amidase [Parapedobacter koreensis]|uniref:N-acetylmuramoyl-L-alanine amidase n=1 Tax=Parapedobacter koreensis TaxID=332977 RepID=A0A1H7T8H7_9SPHI|nr:N-acetylmuramoyl-L-alanine amidase [Parapedobacter koreensis]SEL80815.1 N-acetylmuramoyl-L-alanine amidase [Parapedobacter koreensis]
MAKIGFPSLRIIIHVACVGLVVSACSANRYAKTNKQYKQQVKVLAEQIRQPLPYATPRLGVTYDTSGVATVSEGPQAKRDAQWVGAIHFNLRKPNYVIIHHTAQDSLEQTLHTFTVPHSEVSAHYVIGRHGEVYQLLNDYVRGWHAGAGKWGSVTDLNSVSLGIELDNNGNEPFSDPQIYSLLNVLDTLKRKYNIPTANFIAHSDIAPTRKEDPSAFFPWKRLAERGFGLWPHEEELTVPPENFNPMDALRIIGYDTRDEAAAIKAFKLHYVQRDTSAELTDYDLQVLYALYRKL